MVKHLVVITVTKIIDQDDPLQAELDASYAFEELTGQELVDNGFEWEVDHSMEWGDEEDE